jgi:hypothetical protein
MRAGRKVFKNQTRVIIGGGRGYQLVDLNVPIPLPDDDWVHVNLVELGVCCEYPNCTAQAVRMLKLQYNLPFLCNWHFKMCTEGDRVLIRHAQEFIKTAMLNDILGTTYGQTATRVDRLIRELMVPLSEVKLPGTVERPRTKPTQKPSVLPLRKPRFGQL